MTLDPDREASDAISRIEEAIGVQEMSNELESFFGGVDWLVN